MSSRFSDIVAARKSNTAEAAAAEPNDVEVAPSPAPRPRIVPEPTEGNAPSTATASNASAGTKERRRRSSESAPVSRPPAPPAANGAKLGRPPGKRSDPAYTQVTAYLRKETYLAAQRAILHKQEFSELVEELLAKWLKSRT